ncbi:MAG: 8-oxo-dGTP diphosphatase [Elusimicrobia bacterium]|nr:8-oxo-dGTP diphosphatase [Elusimicrobiota bacterium]
MLQHGRKREQRAVLCFVVQDGRVLLIRKKRGLGAGKINAPGGRIEPGESAMDAARRETKEEVGLTPNGLARAGELFFRFTDGLDLYCTVFTAQSAAGGMIETDEAEPFWCPTTDIPYAEMWADDEKWLPWLLSGKPFRGTFRFEDDRMLEHRVEPLDGD